MKRLPLVIPSLLAICGLVALFPAASTAGPASDDISIQVFLHDGNTLTTVRRLTFEIVFEVESTSGVSQPITIRTQLPDGLRWGSDGPDPGEGCVGTAPAVCSTKMQPNEVGTIGAGYEWDVVADRPGVYEITASVEPTEPDPDTSNNTDTFRFEVLQPTGGGTGGGGGGSGGSGGGGRSVSASSVKLSPLKPKAGSTLVASVRVTKGGSPLRPIKVACTGTLGAAKVKGSAKSSSGLASCLYRTPKNAKGKTLRGAVSFMAGGLTFTKRFAARLS